MIRVRWRTSVSYLGTVLKGLTVPLLVSALVSLAYGESVVPLGATAALSLLVGVTLERLERDGLGPRETFLMVALTWLSIALLGALPFFLAGTGVFADPVNALFEGMSGITTTGATVINDFEAHPRGVLFWRQLLQWLGGLGILILAVALLSQLSVGGARLMETESQTTDLTKLAPRITETARLLGGLYAALTAAMTLILLALYAVGAAPGMTPYNAVSHALTTVSTAGFSPEAQSVGAFSPVVQWVVVAFMFVGATNFVLLYYLVRGDPTRLRKSEEFRFYLAVVAGATLLTAGFLALDGTFPGTEETVRHATFQVVSIVTTTGYASTDFNTWSVGARHVLFLGMFMGGMAGSTTCSIKTFRWLVVLKSFRRDLLTAIHPDAIRPVRLGSSVVDEETIRDVYAYVLLSVVIFVALTVFIVVDVGRAGVRMGEFDVMSAAASTFLNIGPAFGPAGPYGSYDVFPTTTKLAMVVLMWVGRIEIIPVLVLFTPRFWRE
ncbi:TrkH family potassium uptake protein [Halomarina ordinaria]|uniref:TrkH family potassium uptake protein n=1 Tax=Halomarina ordinaria TaxID=3033939 RepID=A0ABD5U8U1_9EURY|nr:TrkH family potassium uptake protein [Halomarina sp. PSRA2]